MAKVEKIDWGALQEDVSKAIGELMDKVQVEPRRYLAEVVSKLCEVPLSDLMGVKNQLHIAQARWLYWNALRVMTKDTFKNIARYTEYNGIKFTPDSIRKGCDRISDEIRRDLTWRTRWQVLKSVINKHGGEQEIKVVVTAPRGVKVEVREDGGF